MLNYPKLCHFKPRNAACIWWNRKRLFLGPWGSDEAIARYDEIVESIYRGNTAHLDGRPGEVEIVNVRQLAAAHDEWAQGFYVKRGKPTKYALHIGRVRRLLSLYGWDAEPVEGLSPNWLRSFRAVLAGQKNNAGAPRFNRSTINGYASIILGMFKWAEEHEIIDPGVHARLKMLTPLKRGRPAETGGPIPREGEGRSCAPRPWIVAARRRLPTMLRVMVNLQLLTGARPGEICTLQPRQLSRTKTPSVRIYSVDGEWNKAEHHGRARVLIFGPRALRLLDPWLRDLGPDDFVFTPARSEELRRAMQAAGRKVKRWPSHDLDRRSIARREKGAPPITLRFRPHIQVDAYRRAVERACELARREQSGRGVPERDRCGTWTPHQLRHNAATSLTERLGIEQARDILGHASLKTTIDYVHTTRRAEEAALKYG